MKLNIIRRCFHGYLLLWNCRNVKDEPKWTIKDFQERVWEIHLWIPFFLHNKYKRSTRRNSMCMHEWKRAYMDHFYFSFQCSFGFYEWHASSEDHTWPSSNAIVTVELHLRAEEICWWLEHEASRDTPQHEYTFICTTYIFFVKRNVNIVKVHVMV